MEESTRQALTRYTARLTKASREAAKISDKPMDRLLLSCSKELEETVEDLCSLLNYCGQFQLDEDSKPFHSPKQLEELLFHSVLDLVQHCWHAASWAGSINGTQFGKLGIERMLQQARLTLPRSGRQKQLAVQMKKRAEVEAAIWSMGTFAKSEAFAKRAAIVVLEKTGYDIPWQTIKSSYLLKMKPTQSKGAV